MVLGKLPVPGRPTILITVGQGPVALAVGAGGGGFGPLNPNQPTNPYRWSPASLILKSFFNYFLLHGPPMLVD